MNEDKLEIIQEAECLNIVMLGVSELRLSKIGHFELQSILPWKWQTQYLVGIENNLV